MYVFLMEFLNWPYGMCNIIKPGLIICSTTEVTLPMLLILHMVYAILLEKSYDRTMHRRQYKNGDFWWFGQELDVFLLRTILPPIKNISLFS